MKYLKKKFSNIIYLEGHFETQKYFIDIKDEIINTISNLSPEVNDLNLGGSMDRIIQRIKSGHAYYKDQINIFNKNNDLKDVIRNDLELLKK